MSNFEELSLMELGVLSVKVEENDDIFQFACRVWFSQSTTELHLVNNFMKVVELKFGVVIILSCDKGVELKGGCCDYTKLWQRFWVH